MSSPVQVREYPIPGGKLGRNTLICGLVMLLSSRSEVLAPGSPIYDYLLAERPTALKYSIRVQYGLYYFLFGAHTIESVIFAATRLRKHGVPVFSLLWFKWMLACFIGGQLTYKHFDNVVRATATKNV
ncbi:hypothetical protein JX266_003558 [Neoarthrinium moseri]|nr:hypothetical protein JX266_003558 [Neoarthrinium moseri]